MSVLTQEKVKKLFNYYPETGKLFWKSWVPSNHRRAGKEANYITSRGYKSVTINYKHYLVHRIIWLHQYGYFPENGLDHIDRNKLNNRLENLREVSVQCNQRNSKIPCNNKSLIKGLDWRPKVFKWRARIRVNNKSYSLGEYRDYHDAVCARLAAEQCLNWEGCDSNSSAYQFVKKYILGDN